MESARILICEDERIVAHELGDTLERLGFEVVGIAGTGDEALAIVDAMRPDLALMDIHLRGSMNGIEVASVLRQEYKIPSIYLTAYVDDDTLAEAKETYPLSYLVKPFDERSLKAALIMAINNLRGHPAGVPLQMENLGQQDVGLVFEEVMKLRHELWVTDQKNAVLRAAAGIGEKLYDDVALIGAILEPMSNSEDIQRPHRDSLKGALIHQDRALDVIETLSSLVNHEDEMTFLKLDVQGLIRETIVELQRRTGKQIWLSDHLRKEDLTIYGDRRAIDEALVQLALNAFQATADQSSIGISMSTCYEPFPQKFNRRAVPGRYVRIAVYDGGKGIPPEILPRITEPCFSVFGSPLNRGLGLSTVHGIMQSHLGWMDVFSEVGHGTKVALYFPLAEENKHIEPNERPRLTQRAAEDGDVEENTEKQEDFLDQKIASRG